MLRRKLISLALLTMVAASCKPGSWKEEDSFPDIFPDCIGVTVPRGMAELEFSMVDGRKCKVARRTEGNTVWVSVSAWKKGAKTGTRYKDFPIYLSDDPIDPYIAYRLIEPSYESWHDMGLYQRELSTYRESVIVTNKVNDRGCVNCHTFNAGDPGSMVFHARGAGGGTVFVGARKNGGQVSKMNLAENGPKRQGAYTAWHPQGRYIVFSSNDTHQSFYTSARQPIEVYDNSSDIIMMDLETDEISVVLESEDRLETFPAWSPDGSRLYFCCAENPGNLPANRTQVRYRLMSMDFRDGRFVGEPQTVLDIDSLSISFPRIKGDKLMFTASEFGTFPIWHDEADLWMLDLGTGEARALDELNSGEADSYHSWSSNGRWVVFSSRRIDGRYTRLYISHFGEDGTFTKPFLLPQKDPKHNQLRLKSYNIPEFITGKVDDRQKEISKLFR